MEKRIGVDALERRFQAILDDIARGRTSYVLTRDDQPEAALIPYDDFVRLQKLQEHDVLTRFERLVARMAEQNAPYEEDEVAADIAAARAERRA